MKKHEYVLLIRDSLQLQGHIQVQSEEADKDTPHTCKLKEKRVTIFMSEKNIHCQKLKQDKEDHYIMIKQSIH